MPLTVADLNTAIQFCMNDASASTYTAAVILPAIKQANEDLQGDLLDNQVPYLHEEASEQDIAIGATALTTVPSDMVEPIEIHERPTTSTLLIDYVEMKRRDPLPDETQTETLRYWNWREQTVEFLGSTAARGIRLRYKKLISALTGDASTVAMMHAKAYLTYRAAGHLRTFIEENPEGGNILYSLAEEAKDKLIGLHVKFNQGGQPIRRKPYSARFRTSRRIVGG